MLPVFVPVTGTNEWDKTAQVKAQVFTLVLPRQFIFRYANVNPLDAVVPPKDVLAHLPFKPTAFEL